MDGTGHGLDEPVKVGELQVWEIKNRTLVHHPFHLHGFFFQVLELNGQASGYLAWKDVFHIPPSGTLKIAWMPDNRPGMWMYHCHVLEHHATGMMASFEVINGSKPAGIAQPDHVARYRMYVPLYPWPTKGSNILYLDSNMNNIALEFGIGVQII